MKKKKSNELLKIGFLMIFLSVALLSTKIYFNTDFNGNGSTPAPKKTDNSVPNGDMESEVLWNKYENTEYLITFSYPNLLTKKTFEDSGGYEFFVRFEENSLSQGKGVALGINRTDLEVEMERVKDEISKQNNARLVKDQEISVQGTKGLILEFEPEDETLEKRSFLFIAKGDYTYSFSTVPEQMQDLIDSIEFLN